jgi:ParB family transcriptional regulator, chromosome partitioning protein
MVDKKRGLGRGLEDLLSTSDWLKRDDIQLFYCPVEKLTPNPYQPRQILNDALLEELVQSIQAKGVLQPILVTGTGTPDQYQILAGERRWRAATLAGLTEVPVILRDATSADAIELALIENIQRQDLNCIEEALAYKRLQEEFHLTQEDIARRVGKDRTTVANLLRILQLPASIQEHVLNDKLTMGHARALLSVAHPQEQIKLCGIVISRALSVRQTEDLVKQAKTPCTVLKAPLDPKLSRMQENLQAYLGVKVQMRKKGNKGSITISFTSDDELQQVLGRFGLNM